MKNTGIARRMDDLGRIVIPMELRKTLDIKEKDKLDIYVEGEIIMLKKVADKMFCRCNAIVEIGHSYCHSCGKKV